MKYLIFFLFGLVLMGCSNTSEVAENMNDNNTSSEGKPQREINIQGVTGEFKEGDPIQIQHVELKGNNLHLSVQYGGGCKDHSFEFIGSPMIMKSYPPKRTVQLYHNANGDQCKGYITTNIIVDLKLISEQQRPGDVITLLLDGWDKPIEYKFEKE